MGFGWLEERSGSGSGNSSAPRSLSSLKGGSVTLLDYWFPCAKPNSECADVALCPGGKWNLKQPLKSGIYSGCMLVVEQCCLVNCLVVPSLHWLHTSSTGVIVNMSAGRPKYVK